MSFLYSNILHFQDHYYILADLLHMEQRQWKKKSHGKTQGPPPKHTVDQTSWWNKLQEITTWKWDSLFQADRYDKASSIFYATTTRTYLKRDMHTSLTPLTLNFELSLYMCLPYTAYHQYEFNFQTEYIISEKGWVDGWVN